MVTVSSIRVAAFGLATMIGAWIALLAVNVYWNDVNRYDRSDALITCAIIAGCWAVGAAGLFRLLLLPSNYRIRRSVAVFAVFAAIVTLLVMMALPGLGN